MSIAEERLKIILSGKEFNGISPNSNPNCPPVWYNPVAFRHAQQLWKTYSLIIRISQLYGLNLVLYHERGLLPLLVTGNSESIPKLFNRYLSTGLHVSLWYEYDPFDPSSKSYRSLKIVRGLHRQVEGKMNATVKHVEPGELWISQNSMSMAQFTFMGLMTVFPIELGFHNFTPKDFHAMFHFWRVIGYCLGIDDQYNLCNGTDQEIVELCRLIYYTKWKPEIQSGGAPVGVEMSKGICTAISIANPAINFRVLMRYASPFLQLNVDNYPLQSLQETFLYYLLGALLKVVTRSRFLNWCLARLTDFMIRHTISNRKAMANQLRINYPDTRYTTDRCCPFPIKINYADVFELNLVD